MISFKGPLILQNDLILMVGKMEACPELSA